MPTAHEQTALKPAGRAKVSSVFPLLAVLGAVFLWGGSFSAMRSAVSMLHPMTVMWLRMALALVAVLPFLRLMDFRAYQKGDWKTLVLASLLQPCLYFWLESTALTLTTSAQAGIISASVPLLVALAARIFLMEPLSYRLAGGMILSILSVTILTLSGSTNDQGANPILGNTLEIGAMTCAALNMILIRRLSTYYSAWTLTVLQILAGFVFFSPGLWPLIQNPLILANNQLILILLFLGVCVTLGAFSLYNWGIVQMGPSKAAMYINLVPVLAVVMGCFILGERLTVIQALAGCGVLLGVIISQTGRRQTPQ